MSGSRSHSRLRFVRIAVALIGSCALAGCALVRVLGGGGIRIGELVEGELTYSDDGASRPAGYFYWDSYSVRFDAGKRYAVEFECEPGVHMHLSMSGIGADLTTRYDSAETDGYLYFELPDDLPSRLEFSVFLISEEMNRKTWYRFRFTEL